VRPVESRAALSEPPRPAVALGPTADVSAAPAAPVGTVTEADLLAATESPAAPSAAVEEIRGGAQAIAVTEAAVVTGVSLTAGYVLLNTRAVYWFLSALLARPAVWRPFDPLEVIFAWEGDDARTGDDESLASMV
jgi:hypothetical protein